MAYILSCTARSKIYADSCAHDRTGPRVVVVQSLPIDDLIEPVGC